MTLLLRFFGVALFMLFACTAEVGAQNAPTIEVADEPETKPEQAAPAQREAGTSVGVELNPALLESVWDPDAGLRTKGVRVEEAESYYEILRHARDVDYAKLKQTATKLRKERIEFYTEEGDSRKKTPGPFVDVFKNEKLFHGKPVTFRGRIRRLLEYQANENAAGITTLYEAWIYTEDSQRNPAVIVATSIPEGMLDAFKEQREILDNVSATGYFFKMYVYEGSNVTEDGSKDYRLAPMMLAPKLEWTADSDPPITPEPRGWLISGIAIAVTLLAVVVMWRVSRKDKVVQKERLAAETERAPDFNALPEDLSNEPDFSDIEEPPAEEESKKT